VNIPPSPLFYLLEERKKKIIPSTSSADLTQEEEAEQHGIPLRQNLNAIFSLPISFLLHLTTWYPQNRLLRPAAPVSEPCPQQGQLRASHGK